jgi:hypothetical protein
LVTHEPGYVGGSAARRGQAAERAASRSTSPEGSPPGEVPALALAAVIRRRWLLQALPGFPVAARVDSLPGVAGVALARLTERLAHTLPVQLSCLVVVDHVLGSSLAAGSTTRHAAVFPASAPGRLKRQGSNCTDPAARRRGCPRLAGARAGTRAPGGVSGVRATLLGAIVTTSHSGTMSWVLSW